MKRNRRLLLLFLVTLGMTSSLLSQCVEAKDVGLGLTLMPLSHHTSKYSNDDTNEVHNGVGLSITTDQRETFGIMRYKNSFGKYGWSLSASKEIASWCVWQVCPGFGGAFAYTYLEDQQSPIVAWVQLRYKWVTVITVQSGVAAVVVTVPLHSWR